MNPNEFLYSKLCSPIVLGTGTTVSARSDLKGSSSMQARDDEGVIFVCVFAICHTHSKSRRGLHRAQSSVRVTQPQGIIHSLFVEENQFPFVEWSSFCPQQIYRIPSAASQRFPPTTPSVSLHSKMTHKECVSFWASVKIMHWMKVFSQESTHIFGI